jgi:hypothetical protein
MLMAMIKENKRIIPENKKIETKIDLKHPRFQSLRELFIKKKYQPIQALNHISNLT